MKLDILVIAAHPDDAEVGCAGTLARHLAEGRTVGVADLTQGELGTRGSAEIRLAEAAASSQLLGLHVRENLGMRDGFFANDEVHQLQVIQLIRRYQPELVLTNPLIDCHPDHVRASNLVHDATFLAGLPKVATNWQGTAQAAWRPRLVLQMMHNSFVKPDILVDISPYWPQKLAAITAFKSQFYHPEYDEPTSTCISTQGHLLALESLARELGRYIQVPLAEGFTCRRLLGVESLFQLR